MVLPDSVPSHSPSHITASGSSAADQSPCTTPFTDLVVRSPNPSSGAKCQDLVQSPLPQPKPAKESKGKERASEDFDDEIDFDSDDLYANNDEETLPRRSAGPPISLREDAAAKKLAADKEAEKADGLFSDEGERFDDPSLGDDGRERKMLKAKRHSERAAKHAPKPATENAPRTILEPACSFESKSTAQFSLSDDEDGASDPYLPDSYDRKETMHGKQRKIRVPRRPSERFVKHAREPTAQTIPSNSRSGSKSTARSSPSSGKRNHQELVDNDFTTEINGTTQQIKPPVTQSIKTRRLSDPLPRAREE